jgi:hypothetical protein
LLPGCPQPPGLPFRRITIFAQPEYFSPDDFILNAHLRISQKFKILENISEMMATFKTRERSSARAANSRPPSNYIGT